MHYTFIEIDPNNLIGVDMLTLVTCDQSKRDVGGASSETLK